MYRSDTSFRHRISIRSRFQAEEEGTVEGGSDFVVLLAWKGKISSFMRAVDKTGKKTRETRKAYASGTKTFRFYARRIRNNSRDGRLRFVSFGHF